MSMHRRHGLVSVVVTSWNRRPYILKCLNQLAAQTYPNIEIIIVDDASSDGTQDVIRRWKRQLRPALRSRIVFASMPKNMGYSGAMTTGMFLARGEYIATQDSDDYSHADRISRQVAYLRNHRHIGLIGTNYRVVREGKVIDTNPNWLAYGLHEIRESYGRGAHCITCGSLLFRARLFDKLGGFNHRIDGAEDYEFVARLVDHGVKMDNLPDVLYYIREHSQQRSRTYYGKKK